MFDNIAEGKLFVGVFWKKLWFYHKFSFFSGL